jgi:transporter family protein
MANTSSIGCLTLRRRETVNKSILIPGYNDSARTGFICETEWTLARTTLRYLSSNSFSNSQQQRKATFMAPWLIMAACCVGTWGVWGFLAKLTTSRGVHPLALSAVSSITGAVVTWIAIFFIQPPFARGGGNLLMALLTGICGSLGGIAFFFALGYGRASIIVPLSSLYPAITILLSLIFLGERPTPLQGVGVFFALVASILLGL